MSQPYSRTRYGRGNWIHRHRSQYAPAAAPSPSPPFGELIEALSSDDYLLNEHRKLKNLPAITGTKLVASYNWLNDSTPRIVIPGKPPRWTPPTETYRLRLDSGIYYRDRNSVSYPAHPLEPAVVSVMEMNPTPCHIDIFACASTLGNLLRFVQGDIKPFRMLVEVVGETVHLVRRENTPKEQIIGVKGYGHTFPEAYTTWEPDVKNSHSHQRILQYSFGGLDMMVRFEGDGYMDKENEPGKPSNDSGIIDQLQGLNVKQENGTADSDGALEALKIGRAGETVPQERIFDLKTRSIKRQDDDILDEQLPRLWIAQVSKFMLAYHTAGVFDDVKVKDIKKEVQEWEVSNKSALGRLVSLLRHIINTAQSHQDSELEIVGREEGRLEIRKRAADAGTVFSAAARQDWAEWLRHDRGDLEKKSEIYLGSSGRDTSIKVSSSDEEQD